MDGEECLNAGDSLIVVDVQRDFLPGGSLAVPCGNEVVDSLNRWIEKFTAAELPIFATRDWHPQNHCSFKAFGGPWPPHCVAGTAGAAFADYLKLPVQTIVISKGTIASRESYSAFEGTDLERQLRSLDVRRLFVGGLATDYCVLNTVADAIVRGFTVFLLTDSVRAVNLRPEDGRRALEAMERLGARPIKGQTVEI